MLASGRSAPARRLSNAEVRVMSRILDRTRFPPIIAAAILLVTLSFGPGGAAVSSAAPSPAGPGDAAQSVAAPSSTEPGNRRYGSQQSR